MSVPKQVIVDLVRLQRTYATLRWQSGRQAANSRSRLDHGRSIVLERLSNAGLRDLRQ